MYLSAITSYHDPVYDETGTPGGADVPIPVYPSPVPEAPEWNPLPWVIGFLLLMVISEDTVPSGTRPRKARR